MIYLDFGKTARLLRRGSTLSPTSDRLRELRRLIMKGGIVRFVRSCQDPIESARRSAYVNKLQSDSESHGSSLSSRHLERPDCEDPMHRAPHATMPQARYLGH